MNARSIFLGAITPVVIATMVTMLRAAPPPAEASAPFSSTPIGAVTSVTRDDSGITVQCATGLLRLDVFGDRIIRVRATGNNQLGETHSLAVISKSSVTKWEMTDAAGQVGVKTNAVEARVERASGAVSFIDVISGKTFLAEESGGHGVTSTDVAGGEIHGPSQSFAVSADEGIYGLGQHPDGAFNYVGSRVRLLQENTKIGVPVLTSTKGYLLLWDNPAVTEIDATERGVVRWSSESGAASDYYVCYGPELDQAIRGYRTLTGAAPMFGRWAFGLWQSKERYQSQEEILGVAREYRQRQIPIDGIIQDWQYWSPQPWGSHAFGPKFPDPSGLVRDLHAAHFHTLISVWAKFDKGSKNYDELEAADHLYPPVYPNVYPQGEAKWYDPFSASARAMYWRQINEQIGRHGWDGWWLDATEPELGGKWGEYRTLQTGSGPGYAIFNGYPLMTTTAVYEGQRARTSDVRSLILTRSAYAGQQRNGAIAWSGDVAGNWDVFRRQVPAGLNFVASGIPYWNTDTGGFFGGDPRDPEYAELFTRWFQFSTFCPMLRVHGTGPHKALWLFDGTYGETVQAFNRLRYRLLPYIYAASWDVTDSGGTMMRPLFMDFRDDPNVRNVGDQYLFGHALMACPVTESVGGTLTVVPPTSLIDATGKAGGLSATYFAGDNFQREVIRRIDPVIDFEWDRVKREGVGANPRKDPVPALPPDRFSARWEGAVRTGAAGTYKFQLRADDGMRMWINGKLVVDDWNARPAATRTLSVELAEKADVPIKVEYFQDTNPALINLRWQPPGMVTREFTRKIYLPAGQWHDFWTGEVIVGARTFDAAAPIERMPLFVRGGSIVPLGPVVQYASEQPDAPLELRVYRGGNGKFTLYDDAGDGYAYERGERSTIPLSWDDDAGTLTIGKRVGAYPGMPATREFHVVFVDTAHGVGIEPSQKVDQTVRYDGSPIIVRMP
jgi:alpha-D-xyloside xylohydrolase